MAQFIPSIDRIQQFRIQPTEGEWHLLHFLEQTLDDSYEVYFNPFLNGDRPDVVIMQKGGGVMIIEVKDWDLDLYELDDKKHWHLKFPKNEGEKGAYIKSPIDQVLKYKENLYNLHIEKLLEQNIFNPKMWGVVTCGVYFHNASHKKIQNFLVTPYSDNKGYQTFIRKIELIGHDDLTSEAFNEILAKHYMTAKKESFLFSDALYEQIHRLLIPPIHLCNQGQYIMRYNGRIKKSPNTLMYSKKQDELIYDEDKRKEWRVKGVVGSGKTTLLAAKAVRVYNELVEHGIQSPKILILTFNITLKNFIHDKIQQVYEEFDWSAFTILNYHHFINSQLNNLGIDFRREDGESSEAFFQRYYDNYQLFAENASKTERFNVIFIDEIQDYKRVWMDIIKDCFLVQNGDYPNGGYYLLGDVKQNIYDRKTEGKDVVTNVRGVNTLETCFRSDMKIKDLAVGFQQVYFQDKYDIDRTMTSDSDKGLFEGQNIQQGYLNYMFLQDHEPIQAVFNIIEGNIENKVNGVAINDITVLGAEIDFLKRFDTFYRYKTGLKTATMFETYEVMFLQAIRKDFGNISGLKEGLTKLMGRDKDKTSHLAEIQMANLFAAYEMYVRFNETFKVRLESLCIKYKCTSHDFLVLMNRYKNEYDNFREIVFLKNPLHPQSIDLKKQYDYIQENKKYNFWMNTGTIKISTIHSFKGWESETIFLILQNRKDGDRTFNELLYTGLTRTRSNLIVINLGNQEYHENMKRLIETYK